MADHHKTRSILGGILVAVGCLASMLSLMHGCELQSLWIEIPMALTFIIVVPEWTRRATTLRLLIVRFVGAAVFMMALEMGYLWWLHSSHFPGVLLFPKPRLHHRAP